MTDLEQLVREFYCRIGREGADEVFELLAEDVVWTIPGAAAIPYAGTFRGKKGVAEFFRVLYEHEDLEHFAPREFIVDEKQAIVCVLGSEVAVARRTGKRFTASWAELFWVKDGLIVAFEEHIDTYALAEAYGEPELIASPA